MLRWTWTLGHMLPPLGGSSIYNMGVEMLTSESGPQEGGMSAEHFQTNSKHVLMKKH